MHVSVHTRPPAACACASSHLRLPPLPLFLTPSGRGTAGVWFAPIRHLSCDLVVRLRALVTFRSACLFGRRTSGGGCCALGLAPGSVGAEASSAESTRHDVCGHSARALSRHSRPPDPSGLCVAASQPLVRPRSALRRALSSPVAWGETGYVTELRPSPLRL